MIPTRPRRALPDLIDATSVLDLFTVWTTAINDRDTRAMVEAQKKLRSEHAVWLTRGTLRGNGRDR